jgi:GMP synthase-like glutamine amidotransferase
MESPNILIIQNNETETLGLYEKYLIKKQIPHTVFHAYKMKKNDTFPSIQKYNAFIVGPTPISANEIFKHDFLIKEWKVLQKIVKSNKPTLGVCCGGQILSKILGGTVIYSPNKEIGGYNATLTKFGKKDQLFLNFPNSFKVFQWHNDMFTIPPGGKCLVTGDVCPIQSFKKGKIRGIIFHLEMTKEDLIRWIKAYPDEPAMIGKTSDQVLDEYFESEHDMRKLSTNLMENFISII